MKLLLGLLLSFNVHAVVHVAEWECEVDTTLVSASSTTGINFPSYTGCAFTSSTTEMVGTSAGIQIDNIQGTVVALACARSKNGQPMGFREWQSSFNFGNTNIPIDETHFCVQGSYIKADLAQDRIGIIVRNTVQGQYQRMTYTIRVYE